MLLTIRSATAPPILHWKTRLPEGQFTAGLRVSRCGNYIVGGASSGNLYVWSSLGGNLLKVVKGHYRPVRCIVWTDRDQLATAGDDGMVHIFSLTDLVEKKETNVTPIRTWSQHQLPVKSLGYVRGGRLVSSGADSTLVIMEISSQAVIASIQQPKPSECIYVHHQRIFVGLNDGTISLVDLDEFSIHQTEQLGAKTVRSGEDPISQVFGDTTTETSKRYMVELRGHRKAVTAIAVVDEDRLCSGDASGAVRLWDLDSRSCVRVIEPAGKAVTPISSIEPIMLTLEEHTLFATRGGKATETLTSLVTPLQRFPDANLTKTPVPFLQSRHSKDFWTIVPPSRKRPRDDMEAKLKEAQATIARWEAVNQKLVEQLRKR